MSLAGKVHKREKLSHNPSYLLSDFTGKTTVTKHRLIGTFLYQLDRVFLIFLRFFGTAIALYRTAPTRTRGWENHSRTFTVRLAEN